MAREITEQTEERVREWESGRVGERSGYTQISHSPTLPLSHSFFRLFRNLFLFLLVLTCDIQGQTAAEKKYLLGLSLGQRGQIAEAIIAFREALELKPDWAEAHLNLGLALQQHGQLDEAIAEMRVAVQLKPEFPRHIVRSDSHSDRRMIWQERSFISRLPSNVLRSCRRHISAWA